ncbi:PHP domain-containing protein [Halospeciosus flavus]|uniref:PHP domain-containing protein n=1 Tax=Halospeciosus flavus TaxID=3032283 RepID=A0ABD5Z7I5_9EURY|nr:PHP domain-containing protein [Halospeciosus flavus]
MAVYADLHAHTTNSDGELTLETLPAAAAEAGVSVVAVTDHDRPHPGLTAPVESHGDVDVVHGIELRVDAGDQRVDLLGYGVTRTDALVEECERLQRDRVERGAAIVNRVEKRLGVDLGLQIRDGIGRPHVARAVVDHPDTDYDEIGAVFDDLIGDDGPCFVARDVPDFETGVDILADACGLVGLAHPLRYGDPESALALCADLDAVERFYPYDRPVGADADDHATALVDDAIERFDLLATGGSDAHDDELGKAGLSEAEFERVQARLG